MSAVYNLEPQPTASVIIHTTQGEIAVELFAKQTPLTSRNFLQLSLDGYYDGTVFHRLVPGFVLQGGDPTGTGHGGESIYDGGAFSGELDPWPMDQRKGKNAGPTGVNFKDEFHSRLKFNRRGLLGMANEGVPDSNGSQFFFTLGKADELTGKNTMFGRVVGDTIYNLAKIGEAEVEEDGERPLYPARITHVEILINPFQDMKKRERTAHREVAKTPAGETKQKKRKGGKQLLSFGDEEGDGDDIPVVKKVKVDRRIVLDVEGRLVSQPKPVKASAKRDRAPDQAAVATKPQSDRGPHESPPPARTEEPKPLSEEESSPEPEAQRKTLLERTNEEIAAVKASMKRTIQQSEPTREKKKSAFEQLIPESSVRGRRSRPAGATVTKEDQETLDLLRAFRSKLGQVPATKNEAAPPIPPTRSENDAEKGADEEGEVCDLHFIANCQSCQAWHGIEKEDNDDEGWMSHTLDCAADKLGKDLSNRRKGEEELVVIDPLEKARNLKENRRGGRSGGTGRTWDQKRSNRT